MTGRDRRKHPRLVMSLEVDLKSAHNFYSGVTRDISISGLFIETDSCPPIGTRLTIALKFLEDRVRADAEVVWVLVGDDQAPVGMGVRFLALNEAELKSITGFMTLRAPLAFDMASDDDAPDSV